MGQKLHSVPSPSLVLLFSEAVKWWNCAVMKIQMCGPKDQVSHYAAAQYDSDPPSCNINEAVLELACVSACFFCTIDSRNKRILHIRFLRSLNCNNRREMLISLAAVAFKLRINTERICLLAFSSNVNMEWIWGSSNGGFLKIITVLSLTVKLQSKPNSCVIRLLSVLQEFDHLVVDSPAQSGSIFMPEEHAVNVSTSARWAARLQLIKSFHQPIKVCIFVLRLIQDFYLNFQLILMF